MPRTLQRKEGSVERQQMKGVRLPKRIIDRIEQLVREEGTTFSQFMRTAAIKALKRKAQA